MPKKETYPQTLYVCREDDGGKDSYLLCFDTPREVYDSQGECTVAIYELKRVATVKVNVEVKS